MTSAQLAPAVVLPLVIWRVYVRVRRNIGRQPLRLRQLKARIVIWSVILAAFAAAASAHPKALMGLLVGVAVSLGLAYLGVRLTKFEAVDDANYFIPNTIIGVGLSMLVVGRIAYRLLAMFSAGMGPARPGSIFDSPLTLGTLGLMGGYYAAYYFGVVRRARHLQPAVD